MAPPDLSGTELFRDIVEACRRPGRGRVVDSTGASVSGVGLLGRALVLRRVLRHGILAPDERHVGILLPPTVAAVAANLALALDRRVPANLNYTLSQDRLDSCVERAGIRHVVTSRAFLKRIGLTPKAETVFVEDLPARASALDRAAGGAEALLPTGLLLRRLGLDRVGPDETLTVIFTSGTTGMPKGVVLSFGNIASNLIAVDNVMRLRDDDVVLGVLPFFHSYGSTATLWAVLARGVGAVYHTNPLEGRTVGRLCREHRVTILAATPAFLRTYLRRCEPEDLATVDVVAVGGDAMPTDLADAFQARFGVRPTNGYGATETSPLATANLPLRRVTPEVARWWNRDGTVGRPVPLVEVRVTDPETGESVPAGEPGMLWIHGPNVMQGYLGQPDLTAKVIHDGWYRTGDIASVDADGFVSILDRESRFAKIGGEMVPHAAAEEALTALLGHGADDPPAVVVTSVPDPDKGERLVVVHLPLPEGQTPAALVGALGERGLPKLFIPAPADFVEVAHLPILGTGKVDLKQVRQLAADGLAARRGAR